MSAGINDVNIVDDRILPTKISTSIIIYDYILFLLLILTIELFVQQCLILRAINN